MKPRYNPLYRAYVRSLSEPHPCEFALTFVPTSEHVFELIFIRSTFYRDISVRTRAYLAPSIEILNQINKQSKLDVELINLDVLKCKTSEIRYMATESIQTVVSPCRSISLSMH